MQNPLSGKLSEAQWQEFLRKAFPELQRDYARLDICLEKQRGEEARQLAHKLKGVVDLLGMDELVDDLVTINALFPDGVDPEVFVPVFRRRHRVYLEDWCARFLPASS